MKKRTNIQDSFLNACRKSKTPVTIYTTNGVPMMGRVEAFDDFSILLIDKENTQKLIYKSALSTIVPSKEVALVFNEDKKQ
ncbi:MULTISPECIES: RNA chaperone Hfq [Bacillus cereus group]|uniref:RNA-binding protein Hfq n=1 Tax=Bacillus cereus TaxID=1396 RepID=A0A9X6SSR8_BACCE|nr:MULTISPECIES: RNA chaperone Hfq [Bacillus cereus group]MDA1674744.1 RNA chaperone Hfq [Bacillus cereus group sp. TH152-1LC]PDZ94451.1 RNA chaperone Hfq [Bacillus cereus]PGP12671.1 RNA chaperone Hfq [Bacillus cereus]